MMNLIPSESSSKKGFIWTKKRIDEDIFAFENLKRSEIS